MSQILLASNSTCNTFLPNSYAERDVVDYSYELPLDLPPIQVCPAIEAEARRITLSKSACAVLLEVEGMTQSGWAEVDFRTHKTLAENLAKKHKSNKPLKKETVKKILQKLRLAGLLQTRVLERFDGGTMTNERLLTELGKAVIRRIERGENLKNTPPLPPEKPKNTPRIFLNHDKYLYLNILKPRISVDKSKRPVIQHRKKPIFNPSPLEAFALALLHATLTHESRDVNANFSFRGGREEEGKRKGREDIRQVLSPEREQAKIDPPLLH